MKILYTNAKIIDKKNLLLKDVDILTNQGKIEQIFSDDEKYFIDKDTKIFDAGGNVFLAGFINPNSHLIENFFESFSEKQNYSDFSFDYQNFCEKISDEERYIIYKYQILNMIKSGITTFCDDDFYNLSLKKAVKECGIECVYKLGYKNAYSNFNNSLIPKLISENTPFVFGLKSVLENTESNFAEMISFSKKFNKPLFVNGSINLFEAGVCVEDFNKTAVELLECYGALDTNCVVTNCNVLDTPDYDILENYGTKLIFSPSLNLTFGFENVNIYALSKKNLVGLASFKNDYILEMFLTNNLQKNSFDRFDIFSYSQLMDYVTTFNAQILGLKQNFDITVGGKANFVVVSNTNLITNANLFLKNINQSDIKSVITNGNLVFNNNHFIENYHYEILKKQCKEIISKYLKV